MTPELIAHRGNSSAAPENTLAAFRAALDSGAEGVEFDVQLSRDGVPVVIHDENLERTTSGRGQVSERTLEELKRLDAGAWFAPEHADARIPTLEEVLRVLRDSALAIHIELKTGELPYPGLVDIVVKMVRYLELTQRVRFSSFNHHTLLQAARLAPEIPRAPLFYAHLIEPWRYAQAHGFQAVHVERHSCTPDLVRGCREAGLPLRVYTVNAEADFRALAAMGVDAVFTDRPRKLAEVREGMR
jgi:glycerophosphoryl diester phosphodiesterase